MTLAAVMVHAAPDADGRARMALAADLAGRFEALLIGVAGRDVPMSLPPVHASAAAVQTLFEEQEAEVRADLDAARRDFDAAAGTGAPRTAWQASVGMPAEALVREARRADLIVVGRLPEAVRPSTFTHPDPGDVMMRAGRPVLLVPPGLSRLDAAQVVVAWRDSREARRAIHDALPFLRRASGVLLLDVCRSEAELGAAAPVLEEVAAYLAGHGVTAAVEARPLREATVPAELLLAAEQRGADLIVAGGYGHTRLHEWAFGGVTRALLHSSPKCCLLSH